MTDAQLTRILVVDTSALTREILSRIVRDELDNIEVGSAASGEEALRMLEEQRYDLVTTALLLSDMDGLALSRAIRDSHTNHYTPVIVVSGDADSRLLREGFEAGVTDYFDKSNGYKAFGSFIKSFIQRNSGLTGHILFIEDSEIPASPVTSCSLKIVALLPRSRAKCWKNMASLTVIPTRRKRPTRCSPTNATTHPG